MSGRGQKVFLFIVACLTPQAFCQNLSPPSVVPLTIAEENAIDDKSANDLEVNLLPFMQLAHGLSSGPIKVLGGKVFVIENLHYDGKGPDAHFWVGKGSWPWDNGTLVPDENGSAAPLRAYNGKSVTITLPNNLTVNDVDYLAVWCIKFNHNFGHTYVKRKNPGRLMEVHLEPFKQLAHGLRSGPVVVVDRKTFFVPNLHYDGKGPDAHFWVGKGAEPSASGILVLDENGSSRSITAYTGQSVYITLPHNVTVDDVDYFGVWCIQYKHNFGHTTIPKNLTMPEMNGNPRYTSDDNEIIRVKKCCPVDQVLLRTGCGAGDQKFNLSVSVHEHNDTHIDDEPLNNVTFAPFAQSITCEHQKYPLDPQEDDFPLLKNGSLVMLQSQEVLSMDQYCFETVNLKSEDDKDNWVTTAILCFTSDAAPVSNAFFISYAVGISVSALCLILTALVFLRIKEVRDTRGKCIFFYSVSTAAAFICLVIAQFLELNNTSCAVIGYVIQFFLLASFTWLTMISSETLCKILFFDRDAYTQDRKRLYIYIGLGISVPILASAISLIFDRIPDIPTSVLKPQFGRNSCWFDQSQSNSMIYFFYAPIGFAILCNIALGVTMKVKVMQFGKKHCQEISWMAVQDELKPMFRSCMLLLVLMSMCWALDVLSFFLGSNQGAWAAIDIINSLQGLFVFLIFVMHRPVKNKIQKVCKKRRKKTTTGIPLEETRPALTKTNGNDSEFATMLLRADSTEFY